MPIEIKQLVGAMNLDDPIEVIGKGFHRDARNVCFKGLPPNRRLELIAGNTSIANALLPVAGTNKTILSRYDPINKCIYFFNYNSAGSHGIYRYNTIPQTFQRLVEVGVNTNGDVLGFTGDTLYNFDIIYGDSLQGDIIYWIDSLGRPSKINVTRALASGYGTIERSFLDVAKEPSDIPPYVVYENDASNTVNNLRKKLFRVKIRWVFDDNDKSVTSSQSVMPVPMSAFNQDVDTDPTSNCRLAITYQTGPANVKKIEIYVANSLGNTMSGFYLAASIDKDAEGIADNDINTYLFYNDKAYTVLNTEESIQLFDYVPQEAVAQATLNGNFLDYANITEGYPNLTEFSNGTTTSSITVNNIISYANKYFSYLVASQNGKSGFSSGNIHITLRGIITSPSISLDTYTIFMTDGSNITYTAIAGDDAPSIIEGLRINALSKGYTIISNGNNDLVVFKTGISLARAIIVTNGLVNSTSNTSFNAYDWSSKYGFGIVYFDQKGRTNGVVYTQGFSIQTIPYTEDVNTAYIPLLNASIYHQPPDWAYYFQWVRTKNLSKQNFVQWVTDRSFKDSTTISGVVKYAYLSIESLNTFVLSNPGSPIAYGFTSGDRVRFFKRYNSDGTTAASYGNSKDFEIVEAPTNPTINGEVKSGQFVKIVLPTTGASFDFGSGYDNYFIELYTPAQPLSNDLNLYYEFGERYAIGNPTLSTRIHQGMDQNQTTDYITPATYSFTKGDAYVRMRSIQTGNVYSWSVSPGGTGGSSDTFLIGLSFNGSTYSNPNVTAQSVALAALGGSFNPAGDSRWFLRALTYTTFTVRGTVTMTFGEASSGDSWRIYFENRFSEKYNFVEPFDASNAGTYSFNFSRSVTLEDDRIFLITASLSSRARTITFSVSNLTFTIDHVINQKCIDPNFSDYFQSAVNSNGRAFIFDENANRVTFPVMHRWSLAYQQNTDVNQTNRFFAENFDEVDRSKGPIMRMGVWDRTLTFFQERKIGWTGIFQKYITDNAGNNQLLTTDSVITTNNVSYYDGDIGVANQPASVVQSGFRFYGVDPIKNIAWRLSRDGITDLSELYKIKTWASDILPRYLNPGAYVYGGSQRVLGVFNIRPDNVGEYIILAQGTEAVAGEMMAFEEAYNSFYSKMDIDCDSLVCAENVLFYFKAGILWKQDTGAGYSIFFGTAVDSNIELVFNDNSAIKKVFDAIGYMSNATWNSNAKGDIETNSINSQTGLTQESLIMDEDFDVFENPKRYAAFNFDMNSGSDETVALWEGDKLNGEVVACNLKYSSNTGNFVYLYSPFINYQVDNRNP